MRIGLNLLYMIPDVNLGTETYAWGLVPQLPTVCPDHEYVMFVNREAADWCADRCNGVQRVVCPTNGANRMDRYRYEQVRLPRLVRNMQLDLLHSLGYVAPLRLPCPSVVTVHDMNFKAFGETLPLAKRLALSWFVPRSVRSADRVITVSRFSQGEIVGKLGVPEHKVKVTYIGSRIAGQAPLPDDDLPGPLRKLLCGTPFCAAFGGRGVNKNLPRLLAAFRMARRAGNLPWRLVVVGCPDNDDLAHARDLIAEGAVALTGYVPDQVLASVLSKAGFLIMPSLYEGFGVPVLDAMTVGTPVLCSSAASLPEVAGDAALYFDPRSVEDLASKIVQAAADPELRAGLRRAALRNARRFSWRTVAENTAEVYEEVLGARQQGRPS